MSVLPYSLEQDLFDRKNQALALIAQGQGTDPLTVGRLLSISRTWPALRPGAVLSFAQAGLDASHPLVRSAAQLAVKQNLNTSAWHDNLSKLIAPTKPPKPFDYSKITSVEAFAKAEKAGHLDDLSTKQKKALAEQAFHGSLDHGLLSSIDPMYSAGRLLSGDVAGAVAGAGAEQTTVADAPAHTRIGGVDVTDVSKAVTREAGALANLPLQGLQGSIRNVAGGGNPLFSASGNPVGYQTDVGQQYANALHGGDTSLGDGFLPSPKSAPAQQAVEAQRTAAPLIGGHAFTLGRYGASQVFEPDTNAFNILSGVVDAGIAFHGDPTARVLKEVGDARIAARTFDPQTNELSTATGLYPTTSRPFVDQPTKANYLASPEFDQTATKLMDISQGSPSRMMRAINNADLTSPTFPVTTIHGQPLIEQLAAAARTHDLDAFRDAIAQATEVQAPLAAPGMTYHLRQGADYRVFATMPTGTIVDPFDKNVNWKILDDVMRAGKVPINERDVALDRYLTDPSPIASITAVSDTIEQRLIHRYGVDPATAHEHASFFANSQNTSRLYDVDQATGIERVRPGIGIAGEGHPIPAPTLLSEGLNSPIAIPDLRALRRQASSFNFITGSAPWKVTQTALAAPSMLWKPLQVLTARMAVRIFGESQLNMLTRGMNNAFSDPIDTIGLLMGANQDKRWETLLEKVPGFKGLPSYLNGPDGLNLVGDTDHLFMHAASFIHDPETIVTKGYHGVPITHPDAGYGLAEQLGRMHADPIMRGVAEQANPADAKEWFWSGDGKDLRLARAPITANTDEFNMQKLAAGKLTAYDPIGDIANDRAAADKYLDTNFFPRLHDMTGGGHEELMDAVKTGRLAGRDIYRVPNANLQLATVDQRAADYAKSLLDQGIGPQRTIPLRQVLDVSGAARASHYARTALDWTFLHLVDLPDRELNRIPAWSQALWNNTEQLAPYLEDDGLATLIANAEKAKIPADQLARIRNTVLDTTSSQRLSVPQLTQLAKYNAADDIRMIVHDLTTRSQFFDMTRALLPFGDAFRLIATRMAKLAADEPQVVRRLQQGIQAAQAPGSSAVSKLLGDPVRPGDGFFHTDPTSGEQVFTFPGSTLIDQSLLGVPVPLQGQVSGLNMLGEGYPGFGGPMVTIGAKWFLPDNPTGNAVRDVIFPYGGADSQGVGADLGNAFIPSWLSKIIQGPVDQKTFNNTVADVMRTLASSGDYNLKDPKDLNRLASDAKTDARWLYVIRGAAQFVSPGAPSPSYQSYDKHGHLVTTQVLADAYRKHETEPGGSPDKALGWLIANFGTKNIFVTQPGSAPNSYAAPTTKEAQAWVDNTPGVAEKYPLTYGLFAPTSSNYAFDQTVYNEQFTKGERRSLSPKEQVAQAENRLGFYAYDHKKAEILKANGGANMSKDQQAWLRKYRTYLQEQFPGFDTYLASPYDSQKRRNTAIDELTTAVKDPKTAETDAGRGLAQYLGYRAQAIKAAKAAGLASPFQAKSFSDARQWLRSGADAAIKDHPAFRSMWEQIFSHEFTTQGA